MNFSKQPDTELRSLVKTVSYRCWVAMGFMIAGYLMNQPSAFALKFIIISFTVGGAMFWTHEKLWGFTSLWKDGAFDLKRRSVAKTVTWRLWSMFCLYIIGLLLGLTSNDAIEWTIVTNIIFIVLHYVHERMWNLISWGKKQLLTAAS